MPRLNIKPEQPVTAKGLHMRLALTIIGFIALVLLAACTAISTTPYTGTDLRRAQDDCNHGNGAACNAANRMRAQDRYGL
jgi:hypothetical protein